MGKSLSPLELAGSLAVANVEIDEATKRQVQLEVDSVMTAVERYRINKNALYDRRSIATASKPEYQLLKLCIIPLTKVIKELVRKKAWYVHQDRKYATVGFLEGIKPIEAACIITKCIINSFAQKHPKPIGVANNIYEHLRLHYTYCVFKEEFPHLLSHVSLKGERRALAKKDMIKIANEHYAIDKDVKRNKSAIHIGMHCIMMFKQATGLIKLEKLVKYTKGQKKHWNIIVPVEGVLDAIDNAHARSELFKHYSPPMLRLPIKWTNYDDGGYVTNFFAKRYPLIKQRRAIIRREAHKMTGPKVYEAVNHLQETAYRINNRVYDVFKELIKLGGDRAKLPNMRLHLTEPARPWNNAEEKKQIKENNSELFKNYCKMMDSYNYEWEATKSKRVMTGYKLEFCERYKKESAIYYPWFLDWRGRLYPFTGYVNPQMDDSGKALIEYARGQAIGDEGIYWLEIHGANCFGNDKIPFNDRVRFIREIKQDILRSAQDPIANQFWMRADDPFKFLAFCFEYNDINTKYKRPSVDHYTYLPVAIDGSCNGLQHYAALLRDETGAKSVNLMNSLTPQDVYAEVARVTESLVELDVLEGNEQARKWKGKIDRSVVKRNVMTLVYNVSRFGMGDQLLEVIRKKNKECGGKYLDYEHEYQESACDNDNLAARYLANTIHKAMSSVNVAAIEGMDWLKKCAYMINQEMRWPTPIGFYVIQHYRKTIGKNINTIFDRVKIPVWMVNDTEEISRRKQVQGIAPNFIHSLDSSHAMKTILLAKAANIQDLSMVHDSYATHANKTALLGRLLREAFVEQYSVDILAQTKNYWEVLYNMALPDLPAYGSLDINQVAQAPYFFA